MVRVAIVVAIIKVSAVIACVTLMTGCYALRSSSGAGQTQYDQPREVNPEDVALPDGYRIEAVAEGLTFPVGIAFDDQSNPYVVESGYAYGEVWTTPKLLRLNPDGTTRLVAKGLERSGPWTGVAYDNGRFYVADGNVLNGGRVLRINLEGEIETLIDGLPSLGDHHTDGPVIGSDGWLYVGQGTASNSGVVGEDNYKFGWLKRYPQFHDVPGQDVVLAGDNFHSNNPITPEKDTALTGAFVPFGTPTNPRQVVRGQTVASGSIFRMPIDGGEPELVAWGFRNPFGLAFSPEGKLYVTDNGYDDRGSRPVWGAPDVLWEVERKTWYGWPDFAAGEPLTHDHFKPPGKAKLNFLLAEHPNQPPKPVARFPVHASADGFDFSTDPSFGHAGQAFVALFGDEAPATGKVLHPVGCKVVRVDLTSGLIEDFAVNKGEDNGPASYLNRGGLERPVAARFAPNGHALYVVDFGVMLHDDQGARPVPGTGVIWRIERTNRATFHRGEDQ